MAEKQPGEIADKMFSSFEEWIQQVPVSRTRHAHLSALMHQESREYRAVSTARPREVSLSLAVSTYQKNSFSMSSAVFVSPIDR